MTHHHPPGAARRPWLGVHVRWMIRRDLPEVLAVEAAGAAPWSEADFLGRLRSRPTIGMVAEAAGGRLVGYMVYRRCRTHLEVLKLAVDPAERRRGVGTQLVAKLRSKLAADGSVRSRLAASVDERDLAACLFLRATGFRATRVLPGAGPAGDDAYRFVLARDPDPGAAAPDDDAAWWPSSTYPDWPSDPPGGEG